MPLRNDKCFTMEIKNITPKDEFQYFFGYYDLQPYSEDGLTHLAHRVKFKDRLPNKTDVAEVGFIDLKTLSFNKIAETRAWNFQQGALLQWAESGKTVIYNDYDGKKYVARVSDINGNLIKTYDRPFAAISADRKSGLSINFARVYDFRKGYGYCNITDPYSGSLAPRKDGLFLTDLSSGKTELVYSYAFFKKAFSEQPFTDMKLVINHVTFSPSGKKFIMLFRNFPEEGKKWGTVLAVGDFNGNVKKLTNFEVNSHYSFLDDDNIMIYSGLPEWGVYFINLTTGERRRLNEPILDADDIHVNYSPDKTRFIGDGYPDKNYMRTLFMYDFKTRSVREIIKVLSERVKDVDIRCDLHARWNQKGDKISYDTTESGRREIREIILTDL